MDSKFPTAEEMARLSHCGCALLAARCVLRAMPVNGFVGRSPYIGHIEADLHGALLRGIQLAYTLVARLPVNEATGDLVLSSVVRISIDAEKAAEAAMHIIVSARLLK